MDTNSDQNRSPQEQEISPSKIWGNLFIQAILASFIYVLMEWLFFVTKVSSLSRLNFWSSMLVLLSSAGVLILLTSAATGLLMGMGTLTKRLRGQQITQALAQIIPAAILSLTVMMLVDNFTYTLFNFGIVSSRGLWRLLYAAGIILLLEVLVRLLVPAYRGPVIGTTIVAVVFLGIGLGGLVNFAVLAGLLVIVIGVLLLFRGLRGGG